MALDSSKRGTPRKATPRRASSHGTSMRSAGAATGRAPRQRTQSRGAARGSSLGAPSAKTLKAPKAVRAPRAVKSAKSAKGAKAAKAVGTPKIPLLTTFGEKGPKGKRPADAGRAASQGNVPSFLSGAAAKGGVPAGPLGQSVPSTGREARERHQRAANAKLAGGIIAALCALGLVALVAFFVLRDSSVFSVDQIVVEATEHVSQSDAANLLHIDEGTTLLNYDGDKITAQLKRDPWVGSVSVERQFPHTLKITVQEQGVDALVVMNSGSVGWYLGSSGTWIEPVKIEVADGQSVNDAALKLARSKGVLLITGVPATVEPQAGSTATDDVLSAVSSFRSGFSSDFSSKIVSYDASSSDAVSCVMESGVKVSLGAASNISYKEQVASALLEKYAGQITYINVRTPSSPSVRRVGSSDVTQGSGADGASATSSSSSTTASSDGSTSNDPGKSSDDQESDGSLGAGDESGSAESYTDGESTSSASDGSAAQSSESPDTAYGSYE